VEDLAELVGNIGIRLGRSKPNSDRLIEGIASLYGSPKKDLICYTTLEEVPFPPS